MKTNQPNPDSFRMTYKIQEAAKILGVSQSTIRRLIAAGELRVIRKLRHPLIPVSELEKLLEIPAT